MSVAHEISLVPDVGSEEPEQKVVMVEPSMLEANLPTPTGISLELNCFNGSPDPIFI